MINKTDIKALGKRIKEERERLGFSQLELAEIGGVSRATQYMYESGDRIPPVQYLLDIRNAGADFQKIVFNDEPKIGQKDIIHISPKTLKEILNLVDAYARDAKGRLLDREYRDALIEQLCLSVSFMDDSEISWDKLKAQMVE